MNCTSMQHGQDQALMNSEMKDVIQEIPGNDVRRPGLDSSPSMTLI